MATPVDCARVDDVTEEHLGGASRFELIAFQIGSLAHDMSSRHCLLLTRFRGLFNRETASRGETCTLDDLACGRVPVGHFVPNNRQCRELKTDRPCWVQPTPRPRT
jgi:hypothetical protein